MNDKVGVSRDQPTAGSGSKKVRSEKTPPHPARVRLLISGRVQGVGFRFSAAAEARRLGVNGWARNLCDSRVEIVAEGSREALDALRVWAHQGPPAAKVAEVSEQWLEFRGDLWGFDVR